MLIETRDEAEGRKHILFSFPNYVYDFLSYKLNSIRTSRSKAKICYTMYNDSELSFLITLYIFDTLFVRLPSCRYTNLFAIDFFRIHH